MRAALALLLLSSTAAAEPRYITSGADLADASVLDHRDGVVLDQVDDSELEALTHRAHELGRCGGYMVHESIEEAQAALTPVPLRAAPDYTLDREPVVRSVLGQLRAANILATIGELSAMPTRHFQSKSGAAASVWLRDRWRSFAADRPEITVELFDHGYPQKSVIMTIPGTARASEVVVIGGHLDSIQFEGGGKEGRAPGADDDASGIATLTEVARALLASHYRPERTVMFMAYAAEEVGLRGSLSVVREFKKRKVDVVGVLQLDMTNYKGSDRDIWLMQDFTSQPQNRFLVQLIERYTDATWGSDKCGYACSDHAAWHRSGFHASMPFESRMREYNGKIHTREDTLERSQNNADHAVKFAQLGAAFAIELAKGEVEGGSAGSADVGRDGDLGAYLALALLGVSALLYRRGLRLG